MTQKEIEEYKEYLRGLEERSRERMRTDPEYRARIHELTMKLAEAIDWLHETSDNRRTVLLRIDNAE